MVEIGVSSVKRHQAAADSNVQQLVKWRNEKNVLALNVPIVNISEPRAASVNRRLF